MRNLGLRHQHRVQLAGGGERLFAEGREAEIAEQVCDALLRRRWHGGCLRQSDGMTPLRGFANTGGPRARIGDTVDLGDRHREGFRVILFRNADLDDLTGFDRLQALFDRQRQQEAEV